MPGFRRVSEEELLRAWLFRVDRLHLVDPEGAPSTASSSATPAP